MDQRNPADSSPPSVLMTGRISKNPGGFFSPSGSDDPSDSKSPDGYPDRKNPCGWSGTILEFLQMPVVHWLSVMQEHYEQSQHAPAGESRILAWAQTFDILQKELKQLVQIKPAIGGDTIIFGYELARERGRRPDVVILGPCIFVLSFRDDAKLLAAHSDQVAALARDLKNYHAASQQYTVLPILVLAHSRDLIHRDGEVLVISPDHIADVSNVEVELEDGPRIDPQHWIHADYTPLPPLVQAARMLWDDNVPVPPAKSVHNAGIPLALAELSSIAQKARQNNEHHLAFVTGVPGAGKTLLGIRFVHENRLQEPDTENNAVFLSENGPLAGVLRDALKNNFFLQDAAAFLQHYRRDKTSLPGEHIWVFDDAQRARDAEGAGTGRGHAAPEPEELLRLAERSGSWILLVALIGEGQEIDTGEESGIRQWNDALLKMQKRWVLHMPQKLSGLFPPEVPAETNNVLDLPGTLRSPVAETITQWVEELLKGNLLSAQKLAEDLSAAGFDLYLTNDLETARNYAKERYRGEEDRRFGLLASSQATNSWDIPNDPASTRKMKAARWYNDPPASPESCCSFREVATEFACQGLELDFPVICWGNDLTWDNRWESPYSKGADRGLSSRVKLRKGGKKHLRAKNPHQLRLNSYRVLLTRGRDGFFIYVPKEAGMEATYAALQVAGVRKIRGFSLAFPTQPPASACSPGTAKTAL
jgi:DUF2075 family protein